MYLDFFKRSLLKYKNLISYGTGISDGNYKRGDIAYWRDVLFITLLEYCLPISLITFLPGVLIGNQVNSTLAFCIHLLVLLALITVVFARSLQLRWRKFFIISEFYILSIYHLATVGLNGPGIFYLLALTVLIALILPIRFAYWSVFASIIIMVFFVFHEHFVPEKGFGMDVYVIRQFFAYIISLVFIQLTLVSLIDKIFDRLQITIDKKDKLRDNYMRIFNSSPIPMWLFDIETLQFLDVNDAAVIQYGYSKTEFLTLTIQEIRPVEYQKEINETVASNKKELNFKKDQVIHLTKYGESLFVNIESRLIKYKGRDAKLVLATNITAQKKAEEDYYNSILKIKRSEANLQAIFNSTSEGFLLLDEDYQIISFNDKAGRSVFLNKNNLPFEINKSIFDYVDEPRRLQLITYLAEAEQGSTVEYELEFQLDGKKLWMHYTITSVYQDDIKKGICINGRDITEYKTYVQTIEAQNLKLRDISWTQSHMVRAPLARIMGLNSLIERYADNEDLSELINYLKQSCLELDAVVRKIVSDTEDQGLL